MSSCDTKTYISDFEGDSDIIGSREAPFYGFSVADIVDDPTATNNGFLLQTRSVC